MKRLHHRTPQGRRLPRPALFAICFGAAVVVALIIGLILNATLDEETYYRLTNKPRTKANDTILFVPDLPDVIASPFAFDGDIAEVTGKSAVSVLLNNEAGTYSYQSEVLSYFKSDHAGVRDLSAAMMTLKGYRIYVSGVFYPRVSSEIGDGRRFAREAEETAVVKEFFNLGGDDLILCGLDFGSNADASLEYVRSLKRAVGESAVGVALPASQLALKGSWPILEQLVEVCDFLALDMRQGDTTKPLDEVLAETDYVFTQYHMRLLFSEKQKSWIADAQKMLLLNYNILK